MARRPLLWFTVCWIAGSSAASALDARGVLLTGAALTAVALALALARLAPLQLAAACLAAFGLAAGERAWADARNVSALAGLQAAAAASPPEVQAAGTIVSAVDIDGDRVSFRVSASSVRVNGEAPRELRERLQVQVRLAKQPEQKIAAAWKRGDRVSLAGALEQPAAATNFGGFDYRRYLYSQRIHWLLKAKGAGAVGVSGHERWSAAAFMGRFDAVRAWLGARMEQLYPGNQAGYMKGLVLGLREDLDPALFQQFSKLGLTHILAISGLHVAVFVYCLGAILRLFRLTRETVYSALIAAVPMYVLLAGASPSVIRSGIMVMIALLAARLQRLKDGLHLLAAAALLMLIWNPYFIIDVSFQLSFMVTAGLILGVAPFRRLLPRWRRGNALLDLLAVTIVAQAVSFPLSIYYFNQFHLMSIPANLLLVPFISFIVMPLGAASLILSLAWFPAGAWLSFVTGTANKATFAIISWLGGADAVRTIWATPPVWWIAVWYGTLLALFRLLSRFAGARGEGDSETGSAADPVGNPDSTQPLTPYQARFRNPSGLQVSLLERAAALYKFKPHRTSFIRLMQSRRSILLPLLLLAGLLVAAYYPDFLDRTGQVDLLDVGQGDSVLIRTPSGRHLLIDGGGTLNFRKASEAWKERRDPFEVGRKVVAPLLMKRGLHAIDLLIMSHLDSDHIGGLKAILSTIPVKKILWNGTVKESKDALSVLQLAEAKHIPVFTPGSIPVHFQIDKSAEGDLLWPEVGTPDPATGLLPVQEEQNDLSVTLRLAIYGTTFLLAGDISEKSEGKILRKLTDSASSDSPAASLTPIDIMKVSHHGSKTSTTQQWLDYWRPAAAAISVGRNNVYGHPSPDVLERLAGSGIGYWRTDQNGEIQFRITRKGLQARTKIKESG